MANPHSTVAYVEPNYTFSGLTGAVGDGETYDRMPDLEDYCIALDIIVELSSRNKTIEETSEDNKVIVMSYKNESGNKSSVRFMSGTRVGGYTRDNSGEYTPNFAGENVLTSYYADMHITDLYDYGTTELLGIKSVDIDYNSTCVPVISIKFTDVRGMSIFQPSELNDSSSFNGIRGFSKDNIAQSFFHAFFALPLPKFTIVLKGFYGQPVSYQVMCDKFETAFDSTTGSFDVSTRFVGFAYSFMSDISLNVLIAAPYSDYKGKDYWDNNITSRFMIPDMDGNMKAMPRLFEIRRDIETIKNITDIKSLADAEEIEDTNHELEMGKLTDILNMYRAWYGELYNAVTNKYGADYCYRIVGRTEKDYRYVFILTNGKNVTGNDFSEAYKSLGSDKLKTLTDKLYSAVEEYNKTDAFTVKLNNVDKEFKYPRIKTFEEITKSGEDKYVFNGFHKDNKLPINETINVLFGGRTDSSDEAKTKRNKTLSIMYGTGEYQYIDAFVIDLDYSDVEKRIESLLNTQKMDNEEISKKRKALNKHLYEKMRWYPTIENFTKIVMAHVETLMYMIQCVVDDTKGRTLSQLGITKGEDGAVDLNEKDDQVAPFPRITRLVTDKDGYTKSEDAWVGTFNNGIGFREVDLINGLFNGAREVADTETAIEAAARNAMEENEKNGEETTVIPYPLSTFDFMMKKNPYGDINEVNESINTFVERICMRMFSVLALNYLSFYHTNFKQNCEILGAAEAHNFKELSDITNSEILTMISKNGEYNSGSKFIELAKEKGLLSDAGTNKIWMKKYRYKCETYSESLYPISDFSPTRLKEAFDILSQGKYPYENQDILLIGGAYANGSDTKKIINSSNSSAFNTLYITDNYKKIWELYTSAQSLGDDYKNVISAVPVKNEEFLKDISDVIQKDGVCSFCNTVDEKYVSNGVSGKIRDVYVYNMDIPMAGLKEDGNLAAGELIIENSLGLLEGNEDLYGDILDKLNAEANSIFGSDVDAEFFYKFRNGEAYVNEMFNDSINSFVLTECFAAKKDENGELVHDKKKCLFLDRDYYDKDKIFRGKEDKDIGVPKEIIRTMKFIMGLDCFNYAKIKEYMFKDDGKLLPFIYLPKLAVLQLGVFAFDYTYKRYPAIMNYNFSLQGLLPFSKSMKAEMLPIIDKLSPLSVMALGKFFKDWAEQNYRLIKQLELEKYVKKDGSVNFYKIKSNHYEKFFIKGSSLVILTKGNVENITNPEVRRALFNQKSNVVKELTTELMKATCMIVASISSKNMDFVGRKKATNYAGGNQIEADNRARKKFEETVVKSNLLEKGYAERFIDGFLNEYRSLNGMDNPGESSNVVRFATDPSQTTDDMKIELYRYVKQFYDKWACSTSFSDWQFDKFFINSDGGKPNPVGHHFYFIDSFYNKIGNKLMINPTKVSEELKLAITSMDTNVMLYYFLAQIYGFHRCMMKCVQNFKVLTDGISNIFEPIPYNAMVKPNPLSDFVVIYCYESSRNLSVDNAEYSDDGFMLNDELNTPIPIKSRGYKPDSYYKIPAFGVSYGRQYQSYFKAVNVNMDHPVLTEQAIIAKHNILAAARHKMYKNAVAQDLYDIYSNQSYTCVVEMMGCAWVQPLMYFVLLNVPFFKGSYLVSKVRHRLRPGDMTTEVTGVRMSKYCNRMVEDIFSDEMDEMLSEQEYYEDKMHKLASPSNDCKYKVYPISEGEGTDLTEAQKDRGIELMKIILNLKDDDENQKYNVIAAAGIVGNMAQEAGLDLKNNLCTRDSDGFPAGGLCGWNDRYYNLTNLEKGEYSNYGKCERVSPASDKSKNCTNPPVKAACESFDHYKQMLAKKGDVGQIEFMDNTIEKVTISSSNANPYKRSLLNACTTPEDAAVSFRNAYERGDNIPKRKMNARAFYDAYNISNGGSTEKISDIDKFAKMFVSSIQQSINSTDTYACELKVEHFKNTGSFRIKTDKSGTHLAVLFDIILNSDEYYKHVTNLQWLVNNSPTEYPRALRVTVVTGEAQTRSVVIGTGKANEGKNAIRTTDQLNGKDCNESLMKSLAKRYLSDKELFKKECPQFRDSFKDENGKETLNPLNDYKPDDCANAMGGAVSVALREVSYKPLAEDKIKITGKFGTWDVGKSVAWIKANARSSYDSGCVEGSPRKNGKKVGSCKGLCATYVLEALCCIGNGAFPESQFQGGKKGRIRTGSSPSGDSDATNLHYGGVLSKWDFDCIYSGKTASGVSLHNPPNVKLQPGDIAIIGYKNAVGCNHACMYTADGHWYSDFKQDNMDVYRTKSCPYFIYRYHSETPGVKS